MEKITHAVIGIFNNEFDSLGAFDALLESGFTRHQVHLSDRGNSDRSFIAHEDDGHAGRVMQFFKTLFANEREATKYTRVALDSGSVITVLASSEDEAQHALQIMDQNGAIDIDERAAELNAGTGVAGGMIIDDAEDLPAPGLGSRRDTATYQKSRIIEWRSDKEGLLREQLLDATKFW